MPELGSGKLTGSYGPFRAMSIFYLATYVASAPAAAPTAKLGTGEPATGTWTKLGLLQEDTFTVNFAEPTFIEDRRGFKRVLYARAVNQAGSASFEGLIVESDPEAIGRVTGQTAQTISAGGKKLQVAFDTLYDRSALVYNFNAFDNSERYLYVPHAQVRWALEAAGADNTWVLRVTLEALQYILGATNYNLEEGRFD